MKFKINFIKSLFDSINSLTKKDLADIRVPEFYGGEVLCAGQGETCIVLEVYENAPIGIEYTILWKGEIHEHVSETCLSDWRPLSEVKQDPFMLSS